LKIYIIAGEASGDLHGGNLMKSLNELNSNLNFRCWGGDQMKSQGGYLVRHIKELAFMGFIEVLMNLPKILKNIRFCKQDILEFEPDVLVLIDYPGFNLRIAKWAHANGIKVCYYISPQVWAWKKGRVHQIKKYVFKMFVILPFEKDFYKQFNFDVEYVGNPLLDAIENYMSDLKSIQGFRKENKLDDRPIVALLPGSRLQEIKRKLPLMLEAVNNLTDYQIVVACAPNIDDAEIKGFSNNKVRFIRGKTYDILSNAEVALVTSGTATLETALFDVPQVVCYKSSNISYFIAKRLVKIKYISLVNLILDKEVVKELIQGDCTVANIQNELSYILSGGKNRQDVLNDYQLLKIQIGESGASKKVAQSLLKTIQLPQ
jgi:lipid-A-disaccharide synthase